MPPEILYCHGGGGNSKCGAGGGRWVHSTQSEVIIIKPPTIDFRWVRTVPVIYGICMTTVLLLQIPLLDFHAVVDSFLKASCCFILFCF